MQPAISAPEVPVNTIRTLGPVGPAYQVGRPLRQLADGDWLVQIQLLESDETGEYRLSRLLADPIAV
jgi:hypothetical protein